MSRPPTEPAKADVYERFGNLGLLRLVEELLPPGGSVLDVGCASGGLLELLEGRAGHREGIEPDAAAADRARQHADTVHCASVEDAVGSIDARFDVIVLADVLEHVAAPEQVIADLLPLLGPGGRFAVSLPNVAHWSVRSHLAAGRWRYEADGILDDTHVRFFTWHSAESLLRDAGLLVDTHRAVVPKLTNHVGRPVPAPIERVWQRLGRRRPNLFAYQQLLAARRR